MLLDCLWLVVRYVFDDFFHLYRITAPICLTQDRRTLIKTDREMLVTRMMTMTESWMRE